MAETACGKPRLPFGPDASEAAVACEAAAWNDFAEACPACGGVASCIDSYYQTYLDTRAICAGTTQANPWAGLAEIIQAE